MNFSSLKPNTSAPRLIGLMRGFLVLMLMLNSSAALAIKKCQDAEGNWHYGDTAVNQCERSKVTTLDNRGFIRDQNEAPKTDEELAAQELSQAKELAEERRIVEERDERNRLLSVYQTEADIDRQLDNQIYSVESNIAVHNVYLKGMNRKIERLQEKKTSQQGKLAERTDAEIAEAQAKIEESKNELKSLEIQKEQIKERFAREKELFRSIKDGSDS